MNQSAPDVTLVLNAHHEGRLMHRTVRSVGDAIEHAHEHGIAVTLMVVMDRPNEETRNYVSENVHKLIADAKIIVESVDYGDLGLSRNHGSRLAKTKYTGFLDADNLVSRNWITAAISLLEQHSEDIIVHPAYIIAFEARNTIWKTVNSLSTDFDPLALPEYNYWDSVCFGKSAIFQNIPYAVTKAGEGFGPEDWHWNCETLAQGVEHYVVPETVYFYRVKASGSLLAAHEGAQALLPPAKLLRVDVMDTYLNAAKDKGLTRASVVAGNRSDSVAPPRLRRPNLAIRASLRVARDLARMSHRIAGPLARVHERTRIFEERVYGALMELLRPLPLGITKGVIRPKKDLPAWLTKEWHRLHDIEHRIFPDEVMLKVIDTYEIHSSEFSDVYWNLMRQVTGQPDYVFLVPWLKKGGADLVVIHYVQAILELQPDASIVVIATEASDSPWAARLPKGVTFVAAGQELKRIPEARRKRLLATMLVQLQPKRIHLVNSFLGYCIFTDHAKALSRISKLFISAFCFDHPQEGRRAHYLLDHIDNFFDYLSGIYTDNAHIVDELVRLYAVPRDMFRVHYQPITAKIVPPRQREVSYTSERPLKVLWAGRLDRQKRPDVLRAITHRTQEMGLPVEFHVYGSAVIGDENYGQLLHGQDNLHNHGPFDNGLATLPLQDYDLFLMTSEWEGLPNAPLESISGGLPVVAPAVGGLPELITNKKTGYMVDSFDDVEAYISVLQYALSHPDETTTYIKNAQKLVAERHSWQHFMEQLKREKGYID